MQLRSIFLQLLVLVIILLAWQFLPPYMGNSFVFVPFSTVVSTFPNLFSPNNADLPQGLLPSFFTTLYELGIAFAISGIIGVLVGFAVGYFRFIARVYEPLIYLFYSIPGAVLYPPMYLILGIGPDSKIAAGVFLGVFPAIITTASGVRTIKPTFLRLARAMGANLWQTFGKVFIPAVAPYIITGLRIALAFCFIGVIFGEIIVSRRGLGFAISTFQESSPPNIPEMYAVIIIVILLAYLMMQASVIVEKLVIPKGEKQTS
jgi:NitT/TauT family transport system permease protein